MTIVQQFNALSTTKKVLLGFFILVVIALPFQAVKSNQEQARAAAEYAALTPEQRAQILRSQACKADPKQCALIQDGLVNIHNAQKQAK